MTYAYFIATQATDLEALADTLDLGYFDRYFESMDPLEYDGPLEDGRYDELPDCDSVSDEDRWERQNRQIERDEALEEARA